jgi:hypothetical protein
MDQHNGTAICRSANTCHIFHNMYLIYRVTSMQWITQYNISGKEHIYKYNC